MILRQAEYITAGVAARRQAALWTAATAFAVGAFPQAVGAIDRGELTSARIEGDGWRAEGVTVSLALVPDAGGTRGAVVRLEELVLPGAAGVWKAIQIECPAFALEERRVRCPDARIQAATPSLGSQDLHGAFTYDFASGRIDAVLDRWRLGEGTLALDAVLSKDGWQVAARFERVPLAALTTLAAASGASLPEFAATGTLSGRLESRGHGALPDHLEFDTHWHDLTSGIPAGTLATEALALDWSGQASQSADGWTFDSRIRSSAGQAYAAPVFVDLARYPLEASFAGRRDVAGAIALDRFAVTQRDVVDARGSARLDPGATAIVRDAVIELDTLSFPGAYATFLQPFLLSTSLKSMETAGTLAGRIVVAQGVPRAVDLRLSRLSADDGTGRLALYGADGELHWAVEAGAARPSRLRWEGGLLFGLDVGAAELLFAAQSRDFELRQPVRIPVLDGALSVARLRVREAGAEDMEIALDADLEPISLQRLSRAFGWPEFGGQVAGNISDLVLEQGVLSLATTLQARVFDGRVEVSDLRLEQPFGDWPRFYSTIGIYNLDLEQATSAFSFGRITGRLSGYVNELVLFNWMPVEFDLRLYTPPDDRSRHRISQRAVENIGNLGGGGAGVGAALSSGFMRLFSEFNYATLGISCRLANEVCLMDGVEPAPDGGYYLVRGRGLPRIDIIGNADRVDWPTLVAQLQAIARSEGPVIQ